jgi:hypothetical protein
LIPSLIVQMLHTKTAKSCKSYDAVVDQSIHYN